MTRGIVVKRRLGYSNSCALSRQHQAAEYREALSRSGGPRLPVHGLSLLHHRLLAAGRLHLDTLPAL